MDSERTLLQKIVLWTFLGLAVVFTAVNIILHQMPGVPFEDTLLKTAQDGEKTVYTGEQYGTAIAVTVSPEGNGYNLHLTIGDSIDQVYHVEYSGGTINGKFGEVYEHVLITCADVKTPSVKKILIDGGYNPDATMATFCDVNGEPVFSMGIIMQVSGNPWYGYELSAYRVMEFVSGPDTAARGDWRFYGMALFCSVVFAVCTAFPYALFYLRHAISVRDPEPSDFYLQMQKVGSVVSVVFVFIVYMIGVTRIV